MTMRMRAAVLGPVLALLAGCPQDTTPPEPINIDIAVDKTEVVANGTNTVQITINHTSDVKLVASRGKFKDQKGGTVTVTGGAGTVELITCDSRAVVGCAGSVRVSANSTSGDGTGSTRITFTSLENCGNNQDDNDDGKLDCQDPGCVGYACALPAGSVGAGVCQANGTCLCNGNGGTPEPNESSCMDTRDNDCDGLIDCKDANCENKTCVLASGGQGICLAGECGCPGTTEDDPESCGDKIDNDCDGRVDCDDKGCQAKLGELGVTCDEFGRTCSRGSLDGGFGTCSVCPGGENAELTCNDQKDNDCDGLADCDDPQCASVTCGENGRICTPGISRCECSGNGGQAQTTERTCNDGADNDCDGKADCADEDCQPAGSLPGKSCAANGYFCTSDSKCACSGNGGAPEDKETTCFDGADNDCDGLVDCAESVCQPVGNGVGQICNLGGHLVTGIGELTCSSTVAGPSTCNVCSVPGGIPETAEGVSTASGATPSCGDGLDNDCDGPMDCGDPNCTGLPCDTTGKTCTANGKCSCTPSPAGPEQLCTDGLDNDCDGKVDCADTTCDNRACVLANGAPGRCKAGACGCPGIAEDSDATCSDGIDDDCDGLIDCADPDCQATLAAAGKACDPNGKQCGKPDPSGMATCSICSRNEPSAEVSCFDGEDNDCDGKKDCADTDCAGRACGDNGLFCNGSTKACECTGNGKAPEFAEVTCFDGVDNDCDGKADCMDPSCQPNGPDAGMLCKRFGPLADGGFDDYGFRCDPSGACNCSPSNGLAETDGGETSCDDNVDNDCDGIKDCAETFCQAFSNVPGKVCNTVGHAALGVGEFTCSAGTVAGGSTCSICTLPDGKISEYGGTEGQSTVSNGPPTCGDNVDNDCNGPIDCADPNCFDKACDGTGGKCSAAGTCTCTKSEVAEGQNPNSCADGLDNDCDGKVDCADSSCNGLKCVFSISPRNANVYVYGVCGGGAIGCLYPGEPEDGGTACADDIDNDGDTLSDCEDLDCQAIQVLTSTGQYIVQQGQLCDVARGLHCGKADPNNGGSATCSVCPPNLPLPDGGISDESSCYDGVDNDCDGKVDCADTNCGPASGSGAGLACQPAGGWACGATGKCDCFQADGGAGEKSESSCSDGVDNDCDTLADCLDPDCRPDAGSPAGASCGPHGKACDANGACACSPPDGGYEPNESSCSDGIDNDCNGIKDCAEIFCQAFSNVPGKVCNTVGHAALGVGEFTCSAGTVDGGSTCSICTLPDGKISEYGGKEGQSTVSNGSPTCGDGVDNDCNGPIDCADVECFDKPCDSTGGKCSSAGTCTCTKSEVAEGQNTNSCADGLDNDCDGKVDCSDSSCTGLKCVYAVSPRNANVYVYGVCGSGNIGCLFPGEPEDGGTACADDIDNDGDTLSDCEDPDCQALKVLTTTGQYISLDGQLCDVAFGLHCGKADPNDGGAATCSVCPPNIPGPDGGISDESSCYDGVDNDCDGKVDCADTNCGPASGSGPGIACQPAGGWACGATGKCDCFQADGGAGEKPETSCGDGVDNDCDTLADCADPDCRPDAGSPAGGSCGANGKACDSNGACTCSPPDGGYEPSETNCADGIDNDCDALTDCQEPICQPEGARPGAICDRLGHLTLIGEKTCSSPLRALDDGGYDYDGGSSCTQCTLPNDAQGNPRNSEVTEGATPGPPATASITCGDGLDNDCDGRYDCADVNCIGKVCDNTGKQCGTDGRCTCPGGVSVESNCSDGLDDDCDSKVDCLDNDCQPSANKDAGVCDNSGGECTALNGGACVCAGKGGVAQPGGETACGDGFDNDCDGFFDCADINCRSTDNSFPDGGTCDDPNDPSMRGFKCNSLGGCVCPGGEQTELTCSDGKDNDCDGQIDCGDPDCQPDGGMGQPCNANGMRCSAMLPDGGAGTCTDCRPAALAGDAGEPTEVTCYDTIDNDCDGTADCSDTNCQPQPPAVIGAPCKGQSSSQVCVVGAPSPGSSSGTGFCLDPTLGGNLTLAAASAKIASDGTFTAAFTGTSVPSHVVRPFGTVASTLLTATAKYGPDPSRPETLSALASLTCEVTSAGTTYTNQGVVFTITEGAGELVDPNDANNKGNSICVGTDTNGVAKASLRANPTGTKTTVKASYEDKVGTYKKLKVESEPVDVTEPKLGAMIVAPSPNYDKLMGARGSGFRESQNISFTVRDADTNPYPAGLTVLFKHESRGDSFLGDTRSCSGNPRICTASAVTDSNGKVTVTLNSGTAAGIVYVTAMAVAGNVSASVSVTDIAIVGAKTSGKNLSMSCEFRSKPADSMTITAVPPIMRGSMIFDGEMFNGSKTFYRLKNEDFGFTCAGFYGDRFDNVIAIPTVSTLASEAGNATPPGASAPASTATTPAVDGWVVNGKSLNTVAVTGYPGPADVEPMTFPDGGVEPSVLYDEGYGERKRNQRDSVSTVILMVSGEEGFVDGSNGCPSDGVYNPAGTVGCTVAGRGEHFIDLGEPFVDVNDNNRRDDGEYYLDTDGDGAWDAPNGVWDSNTTVWVARRVYYTGRSLYDKDAPDAGWPRMYNNSDGTTTTVSGSNCGTGACNLVILSSDAAGTAKDTPALSSNKDPSATFYATFSDMNLGAPDDRVTYNAGDEPEGSPSPVVTYSLTPPDYGKLPASGVKESVLFCPVDPSVPTNVINTANCSSTCGGITGSGATSVSASGACYPVTSLTLAPRREVSFSASGTGAGITKLGVTATAEVVVREPSQADPSGKKFSYTGATKDAKVTLTLCVRESPDGICSKVTATKGAFACSTKTETDACGFARTVDCGTCETGNTCCTDGTGKSCVNTTTDMYNCGSCGNNCYAKGFGSPACCTGVCVDLLAGTPAKTHCGSCGNNCTGALTCQSGECL